MTKKKTAAEKAKFAKGKPAPALEPVTALETEPVPDDSTEPDDSPVSEPETILEPEKEVVIAKLDNPLIIKCLICNVSFAREVELPKNREIKCSCCKKEIKVNAGLEGE